MFDSTVFKLEAEIQECRSQLAQVEADLGVANAQVAQLRVYNKELLTLAMLDPLTGVENLRALTSALERRKEHGKTFCLARIDIDSFKAVNSEYTQSGGNKVLVDFAALLKSTCRTETDFLYRDGGDEFTVILHDTSFEQAHVLLKRMKQVVSTTKIELINRPLSFSYGIAEYSGQTVEALRYEADSMMQANKEASKVCRTS
ncbi:MAG: GGDEF domain-containing protein [Desulfovibrionales bacterium]|nr:GGDEF domain-containing protein [Desulfovibrionales bacterium]